RVGSREIEPLRAIDLREDLHFAASARPFDLEAVADDGGGVEITFHRETNDALAATLADLAKRFQPPAEGNSRLLRELPHGNDRGILACCIRFAFRDRPCALVLAAPVRSARMHQQDFQSRTDAPVQQDSRAETRSAC